MDENKFFKKITNNQCNITDFEWKFTEYKNRYHSLLYN